MGALRAVGDGGAAETDRCNGWPGLRLSERHARAVAILRKEHHPGGFQGGAAWPGRDERGVAGADRRGQGETNAALRAQIDLAAAQINPTVAATGRA
jgi:hypothetical protein